MSIGNSISADHQVLRVFTPSEAQDRLAKWCRRYSAKELARVLGCAPPTAVGYRKGNWPTARHLLGMAQLFGPGFVEDVFAPAFDEIDLDRRLAQLEGEIAAIRRSLNEEDSRKPVDGGVRSPFDVGEEEWRGALAGDPAALGDPVPSASGGLSRPPGALVAETDAGADRFRRRRNARRTGAARRVIAGFCLALVGAMSVAPDDQQDMRRPPSVRVFARSMRTVREAA